MKRFIFRKNSSQMATTVFITPSVNLFVCGGVYCLSFEFVLWSIQFWFGKYEEDTG